MSATKLIDHGFRAAVERTSALAGTAVKVGYQVGSGRVDGVDILDIAIWNHFGTQNIPARPFMHDAAINYADMIGAAMAHVATKVQLGAATADVALATIGQMHQDQIAETIRSGNFTPNAPSTIARKGSSVPLVDEGRHLIPGLRYEVTKP